MNNVHAMPVSLILAAFVILSCQAAAVACPSCNVTVGGETQPGHNQDAAASPTNNMAAAYYYSILLMMSVPFTLTGILAYTIFRQSRTEAAGPPDGREQGGGQDAQRERQDDLR